MNPFEQAKSEFIKISVFLRIELVSNTLNSVLLETPGLWNKFKVTGAELYFFHVIYPSNIPIKTLLEKHSKFKYD